MSRPGRDHHRLPSSVLLLLAVGLVAAGCGERAADEPTEATPTEASIEPLTRDLDAGEVELYFPGEGWYLVAEARLLGRWETPLEGARSVLGELLAGPLSEALRAPLPEGVALGETHLTVDGRLYVDLISTEHERPPIEGSLAELLTVYSLVDSVLINVPGIESLVLLWNGRQMETFAGHVDTSLPLVADRDLLETPR